MLRNNLELIVQYPDVAGGYVCRGFHALHLANPAYIVFSGATVDDQEASAGVGARFCEEVLLMAGAAEDTTMPCMGLRGSLGCHAMDEPACTKLFVRLAATGGTGGTGTWPVPTADTVWSSHSGESSWQVLPAMPTGANPTTCVPLPWQGINACFWTTDPSEIVWSVMQRAGLSPTENRIFISYVRRDTMALADQLFDALTHEGFDVFLDRCSVPVGVPFQERLKQDLCDKAMMILLNSPGVAGSYWVTEEIAIAKIYRLGLLDLRLPGVSVRADLDPDFGMQLRARDLVSAGREYSPGSRRMKSPMLQMVVDRIKDTHAKALHRRRYELIDNFAAALLSHGKAARVLPNGSFLVPSSTGDALVGVTPRPPALGEYCSLHVQGSIASGRAGWLISPAPFFLADRQAQISWLGGICNIHHVDEAQMSRLASTL